MSRQASVYESRHYRVGSVDSAERISRGYLKSIDLENAIGFGLPEVDDRYHVWRVPLLNGSDCKIGEIVVDAYTSLVQERKTTKKEVLEARLLGRKNRKNNTRGSDSAPKISHLRNTIGLSDP